MMHRPLHVESSVFLSMMVHVFVLAAMLPLASLAPAPPKFDVFAAAPIPSGDAVRHEPPARPVSSPIASTTAGPRVSRSKAVHDVPKPRVILPVGAASPRVEAPSPRAETASPRAGTEIESERVTSSATGDAPTEVPQTGGGTAEAEQQPLPVLATPLQPVLSMSQPETASVTEPTAADRQTTPVPSVVSAVAVAATEAPSSVPVVATRKSPAAVQQPGASGSTFGLGLDRIRLRVDGARTRTTTQGTDVISGTLIGGKPTRFVINIDGRESEPELDGRTFTAAITLLPGLNRVRVLAADAQGAEVEEIVVIHYVPPVTSNVTLTRPHDGQTLGPDDPPLVDVEGRVDDLGVTSVWIVTNGRRVQVPVTAGRFRHVLPVLDSVVRIRAETGTDDRGSETVTVHAAAAVPAIAVSLMDWPRPAIAPAQITATFRPNPARLDGTVAASSLRSRSADTSGPVPDIVYFRDARPGVYTFFLTYQVSAPTAVHPVISVAGTSRSLPAVTLAGAGRVAIARVLMPQGVLWEQDSWFTGRSASGDTVTKFRFPDGVSWTERVGDLAR
jgi:hypothetical protein